MSLGAVLRLVVVAGAVAAVGAHAAPAAAEVYEGLVKLRSKNLDTVYLLPGANFDRRETRNRGYGMLATTGTNSADFEGLFKRWADMCVKGLDAQGGTRDPEVR